MFFTILLVSFNRVYFFVHFLALLNCVCLTYYPIWRATLNMFNTSGLWLAPEKSKVETGDHYWNDTDKIPFKHGFIPLCCTCVFDMLNHNFSVYCSKLLSRGQWFVTSSCHSAAVHCLLSNVASEQYLWKQISDIRFWIWKGIEYLLLKL